MDDQLQKNLDQLFAGLPKPVQRAITSADVENEMRTLAKRHNLHVDQWQALQDEIMLTLLGLHSAEDIVQNLQKNVSISEDVAIPLVEDITNIVFKPIRDELERELGAPQARAETLTDMEKMRREVLSQESEKSPPTSTTTTPSVALPTPATPPTPPPIEKVVRTPNSGAYMSGETSAARANVVDDPYREQPI